MPLPKTETYHITWGPEPPGFRAQLAEAARREDERLAAERQRADERLVAEFRAAEMKHLNRF
jgi:hypothetical protein